MGSERTQAVCLSITLGKLGKTRKIDMSKVEVQADKRYLHTVKKLVEWPEFKAIDKLDGELTRWLKNRCFPSQLKQGVYVLPISFVEDVEQKFVEFTEKREELIDALVEAFPTRVEESIAALNDLATREDYPQADGVRARFAFEYRYFDTGVPGSLEEINSELFAKTQKKFEQDLEREMEVGRAILRETLKGLVDHLVTRLAPSADPQEKPKRLHKTLIGNLDEFIKLFKDRNLGDDSALQAEVDKVQDLIAGVSTVQLKDDTQLRTYVRDQAVKVKENVDKLVVEKPRRKFNWDE